MYVHDQQTLKKYFENIYYWIKEINLSPNWTNPYESK